MMGARPVLGNLGPGPAPNTSAASGLCGPPPASAASPAAKWGLRAPDGLSTSPRDRGEMPERSNGAVSKTVDPSRGPRVRIPVSPPFCDTPSSPLKFNRNLWQRIFLPHMDSPRPFPTCRVTCCSGCPAVPQEQVDRASYKKLRATLTLRHDMRGSTTLRVVDECSLGPERRLMEDTGQLACSWATHPGHVWLTWLKQVADWVRGLSGIHEAA